jgi:Fe-Mn family superoxide dismutase
MPVEELKAMMDSGQPVQMLDATPKHFVARRQEMMVGAQWRDHERVEEWIGELKKDEPVAVFCAYGFHVACRTTLALRAAGFDAKVVPAVAPRGRRSAGRPRRRRDGGNGKE